MTRDTSTGSRLMRWLQRGKADVQRPAPAPDPADMGTCFGLEMSFDDAPVDPFARHPAGAATPTPWGPSKPRRA